MELLEEFKRLGPSSVMEIGSEYGGTLYHWINNVQTGSRIVSVDRIGGNSYLWREWAAKAGVDLKVIIGRSDAQSTIDDVRAFCPTLDFLFIDGDHSYAGGRLDFELYVPLVRRGGLVIFHDILSCHEAPNIEIWKLWNDIRHAGYKTRELMSSPGQGRCGIGIIYV
jgi:predicted O-methyltransferase YrrM